MPGCCAVGCTNSRQKGNKVFQLPSGKSHLQRRNIWISRIRRKDFKPSAYTVLCEAHFEKDQFEKNIPGKLKPNALPTLFSYCPPSKQPRIINQKYSDKVVTRVDDHPSSKFDPSCANSKLDDSLMIAPITSLEPDKTNNDVANSQLTLGQRTTLSPIIITLKPDKAINDAVNSLLLLGQQSTSYATSLNIKDSVLDGTENIVPNTLQEADG